MGSFFSPNTQMPFPVWWFVCHPSSFSPTPPRRAWLCFLHNHPLRRWSEHKADHRVLEHLRLPWDFLVSLEPSLGKTGGETKHWMIRYRACCDLIRLQCHLPKTLWKLGALSLVWVIKRWIDLALVCWGEGERSEILWKIVEIWISRVWLRLVKS